MSIKQLTNFDLYILRFIVINLFFSKEIFTKNKNLSIILKKKKQTIWLKKFINFYLASKIVCLNFQISIIQLTIIYLIKILSFLILNHQDNYYQIFPWSIFYSYVQLNSSIYKINIPLRKFLQRQLG